MPISNPRPCAAYLRKHEPFLNQDIFSRGAVEPIEVDGSQGEGGGQILRTAVAFSAIQGRPVRVDRIRAGREVPGLKRQHLSALQVLAKVFGGELSGAAEGSTEVTFVPGRAAVQSLSMDMGTAASITLVLQAVVPAVALSGSRLRLELTGGTDVPWSPTLDYIANVVRPAYRAIGIEFDVSSSKRGYYPRGGGRVSAEIEPCKSLSSLELIEAGRVTSADVLSRCGGLPRHVADRQLSAATGLLSKSGIRVANPEVSVEQSDSPGSSVLAFSTGAGFFLGADALGERGKPAEAVGEEAAKKFAAAAGSGACLDSNLADMVLPLLSLAPKPSSVSVPRVTDHLKSGLHLASQFTGCSWSAELSEGRSIVTINPNRRG
jgi:RNA 3'-phosphate cyclase